MGKVHSRIKRLCNEPPKRENNSDDIEKVHLAPLAIYLESSKTMIFIFSFSCNHLPKVSTSNSLF